MKYFPLQILINRRLLSLFWTITAPFSSILRVFLRIESKKHRKDEETYSLDGALGRLLDGLGRATSHESRRTANDATRGRLANRPHRSLASWRTELGECHILFGIEPLGGNRRRGEWR